MSGSNDYNIRLGIDQEVLFKGFAEFDKHLVAMENNVTDASKSMKDGLGQAGKAADDLKAKLKADGEAALILRNTAKDLGKDLSAAFSVKGKGKEVEDLVSKFQNELFKIQKNSKINLDVVFNKATIQEIANAAGGASKELAFLNQALDDAKVTLAGLDTNSEEFKSLNEQIQLSEGLLQGLGDAEKIAETGSKSLKAQLKELKADLAAMEIAGQGGSDEFVQMSIKAGELEDQIGDVSARVRVLASDTKYLDAGVQAITAIAGGFAVAQGAAALFGDENEAVNEALKKVTAAMAILQGIQAVANALNKDSALNVLLFSRAQSTAAASTIALADAEVVQAGATVTATTATNGFTAALLANPLAAVAIAVAALVAGILIYISTSDDATMSADDFTEALKQQNDILSVNENEIRRRTSLLVAQAKSQGKSAEEIKNIEAKGLQERLEFQKKYNKDAQLLLESAQKNESITLEESQKIADDYMSGLDKQKEIENQIQIEKFEAQAEANKKKKEDQKKAIDESKKSAEEQKKIQEQILNFTKFIQDAEVAAMKDGFDKQRKAAQYQAEQKIADINKETILSKDALKLRDKAVKVVEDELAKEKEKIDKDEQLAIQQRQISAAAQMIELRRDSAEKELDALANDKIRKEAEINEEFKDEETLRLSLLERLSESTEYKRKEILARSERERLDKEEEIEITSFELLAGFAEKPIAIEEAKQQDILRIQLKYAEARLKLLLDNGGKETDLAVIQAKKVAAGYEQALKDVGKDRKLTMFSLLGLDQELTDKEKEAINASLKEISNSIRAFTDFYINEEQKKIDKRTENIDRLDGELDQLQDALDKEMGYKEKGYAFSSKLIEDEIKKKEAQKAEEIRIRQEAFEQQKKIQKLQLAVDTVIQASSLVTAASNIIKGFSNIPYIGAALGAVAVAAMIAGFVVTKAKAFDAVNNQTLETGGIVGGKRHSQGGAKYRSIDGNSVVELEEGEFVANRKSSYKYAPILEAVNNDDEDLLRRLVVGTGVHFGSDRVEAGIVEARLNEESNVYEFDSLGTEELRSIDGKLGYMVEAEKSKVQTWQEGDYLVTKKGNRTIKRKIK